MYCFLKSDTFLLERAEEVKLLTITFFCNKIKHTAFLRFVEKIRIEYARSSNNKRTQTLYRDYLHC